MSRTSCINEPTNDRLLVTKQWQLVLCSAANQSPDNLLQVPADAKNFIIKDKLVHCAAGLLSFFLYWHEIKLDMYGKSQKLNDVAERHGEERTHDESLLQFHTLEELESGLLGTFGISTIRKAINLLVSANIISLHRNPNPRYGYDRTTFYLVNVQLINRFLINYDEFTQKTHHVQITTASVTGNRSRCYEQQMESVEITNRTGTVNRAITETTAETSTENTTATSAAAFNFKNAQNRADSKITSQLTNQQKKQVTQKLKQSLKVKLTQEQFELYQDCAEEELLDPIYFTKAENDFDKKLNTICSLIRKGKWHTLAKLEERNIGKQKVESNELNTAINNLSSQQEQIDQLLEFCSDAGQRARLEQQRERCIAQIGEKRSALTALQQNNNQAA